ncbi:MAG: hypothetical protein AAGC55_28375, partial [Myxococcota bacterium]
MAADDEVPAGPSGDSDRRVVIAQLERALAVLAAENAQFAAEFEPLALALAHQILDRSEERVRAEQDRYGMTVDRSWGLAGASARDTAEVSDLQAAARQLLAAQRAVDDLRQQRDAAAWQAREPDGEDDFEGWDAAVDGVASGRITAAEQARYDQLDSELAAAEFAHARLRTVHEAAHPALARYAAADQLERVTQEYYGPMQVAWDLDQNLAHIATTRAALGGDLSVFRLPAIIEMAEQHCMVRPGSMRARLIAERVAAAAPGRFESVAIVAIAIGLGLLAAIPTGGSSLAASATVTAATATGVALDAYLVHDAIRRYRVDTAAGGTDPDRARALSRDDPSLFWLAVELIGAGLAGGAALRTFRALARTRKAALAATGPDELAAQLGDLDRLTEAAGLSDDVGERLAGEIRDQQSELIAVSRPYERT